MDITLGLALILIVLTFVGATIQVTTGFGMALVMVAILPNFLPLPAASAITGLIGIVSAMVISLRYRKHINFRLILPPVFAFLCTSTVAVLTVRYIPTHVLRGWLGVVLIGLSIYFLYFKNRVKISPRMRNGIIAGGCGGILSGYFATGGPPIVIYCLTAFKNKDEYLGSIQFYFTIGNIYTSTVRAASGILTWDLLPLALIGYIGMAGGLVLGLKLVKRLDLDKIRLATYVFIGISGVYTLLSTIMQ